jgi:superfamily II DNA/RNA helicase
MKVKKTKKSKGGGFQSMGIIFFTFYLSDLILKFYSYLGLDPVLMKGILHRGYKLPTPIQRKCIPLALQVTIYCRISHSLIIILYGVTQK